MRKPQKPNPEYLERLETVKAFIEDYYNDHLYAPSLNEVADHFGVSTSVANYWLLRLEKDNYLEPRTGKGVARNIVPKSLFKNNLPFPNRKERIYDAGL